MYSDEIINEIKRLDFENFLWILFAILATLNIIGDEKEEEYLLTNDINLQTRSDNIFKLTLVVTFFIYLYFLIRNWHFYEIADESQKQLYLVKLLGSSFLIAGIVCLIYFQFKESSFVGSPAL